MIIYFFYKSVLAISNLYFSMIFDLNFLAYGFVYRIEFKDIFVPWYFWGWMVNFSRYSKLTAMFWLLLYLSTTELLHWLSRHLLYILIVHTLRQSLNCQLFVSKHIYIYIFLNTLFTYKIFKTNVKTWAIYIFYIYLYNSI